MKIIVRVRELRKHHNLTQEELAKRLNISRQSLISLEQGRWLPSLPLALQLADFFHTSLEDVICATEEEKARKEAAMAKDLTPWSPFRELRDMREDIDRIFGQSMVTPSSSMVVPTINVRQDEQNLYLEAHVPGFTQESINIDVADDMVTITGEVKEEKKDDGKDGYIRREYMHQSFSRTIGLPIQVVSDKAEAKLNHGILTITLPKIAEEKPKTKRLKPTT